MGNYTAVSYLLLYPTARMDLTDTALSRRQRRARLHTGRILLTESLSTKKSNPW